MKVQPLSANGIAVRIQRSPQSVLNAIRREAIPPDFELSGVKYYYPAAISRIENSMRRRNGAKAQA